MVLKRGMAKSEIEIELKGKGVYVQLENLNKFAKEDLPFDTKKFIYTKLGEIYESIGLFVEAARAYQKLSELSPLISDQRKYRIKEAEIFIQGGYFDRADRSLKEALGDASLKEKTEVISNIRTFCKAQAEKYEKEKRRSHAIKIYEEMLKMNISESDKDDIRRKLLVLYNDLGKIKEYIQLKRELEKRGFKE